MSSSFVFKKSLSFLKIGFFFIFLAAVGCTTSLTPRIVSGIDADFKFRRLSSEAVQSESETILFYQKILRTGTYSECNYFPSDSVYSQTLSKRCGSFASLFKTFSRFVLEPDAAYLGLDIRSTQGKNRFVDLPESCEIF